MTKNFIDIYGIAFVDKIGGITSHDVVDLFRKKLNIQRVGHAGTLDPLATGLLIILVGKYTLRQSEFIKLEKVYEGSINLGIETDTWDMDGKILKKNEVSKIKKENITWAISLLSGNVHQRVPPYSAVKYKGETLYKLARKNQSVPVINRMVNIKWLSWEINKNVLSFKIKCSSGTYIRSIAHHIGQLLGCGAALASLRRLEIGEYKLEQATSVSVIEKMDYKSVVSLLKK
ncbi:MAG: tRNA pseudouridine(55) synthase TruB [Elusimicrobiota bacterium]